MSESTRIGSDRHVMPLQVVRQLKRQFAGLYSETDGERNTAAQMLFEFLVHHKIGVDDIQLSIAYRDHSATPARKRRVRRRLTVNQYEILRAFNDSDLTVRELSFKLHGEPDSNENLADTVSNMLGRNWLSRRRINDARRAKWLYSITDAGRSVLDNHIQHLQSNENGSG